jgi:ammonia channel protein AmtB
MLTFVHIIGLAIRQVGWYGFNGGSAVVAGADAAFAVLASQISAATAACVWMLQVRQTSLLHHIHLCTSLN